MRTVGPLGNGWGFPVAPRDGSLEMRSGADKVAESIRILLDTEPGERVMRPAFGCGLRRFLMSPNTVATRAQIQREVARTLRNYEPRIRLEAVDVLPGDDPSLVLIHIRYLHVRDSSPGNLVYPFYLE